MLLARRERASTIGGVDEAKSSFLDRIRCCVNSAASRSRQEALHRRADARAAFNHRHTAQLSQVCGPDTRSVAAFPSGQTISTVAVSKLLIVS